MVNGFEITARLVGTPACYYVARRGDVVFTSKSINYIRRKCEQQAPTNAPKWAAPRV